MIFRQSDNRRKNRLRLTIFVGLAILILSLVLFFLRDQYILDTITKRTGRYVNSSDMAVSQQIDSLETYEDNQVQMIVRSINENANTPATFINSDNNQRLMELIRAYPLSEATPIEQDKVRDGYVLSYLTTDSQATYQVLLFYPTEIFKGVNNMIYVIWCVLVLIITVLVILIYYSVIQLVSRPIEAMNQGLNQLLDKQYSFEYVGTQFKALDELGDTVSHLNQRLHSQQMTLINSEQKLSLLLDHLNLGVVLINANGEVELYNPEATDIIGLDVLSVGRSYEAVIKSIILVDMIAKVMETNEPLSEEIEVFVPNSKIIDVNIIPYHGIAKDKGESILVLLYDITQIRRLETVRTEFVANASHELRTPVTAIKGFAETLLDGAIENPELADKFVRIIASESNRLEYIINDILELSRVEKQSEPLNLTAFDVTKVASSMISLFEKQAAEKSIHFEVDLEHQPIMIQGDQHRIEQIFTNLVDNAIKYSDVEGKVTIHVESSETGVVFSVSDTGMGIPSTDQERIFERFYRVDKGRSRNSGGTGLGLSIVRNLIKMLNGTIDVESEVGVGSTFTVYIPYKA